MRPLTRLVSRASRPLSHTAESTTPRTISSQAGLLQSLRHTPTPIAAAIARTNGPVFVLDAALVGGVGGRRRGISGITLPGGGLLPKEEPSGRPPSSVRRFTSRKSLEPVDGVDCPGVRVDIFGGWAFSMVCRVTADW